MRISIAAAATLAALTLAPAVRAETTVIHRDSPDIVVRRDAPARVERREVETTGNTTGCSTKTVTRTNDVGDSKTVRKERCD